MNSTESKAIMNAAHEVLKSQVLAGIVENTRPAKLAAYEVIVKMILELKAAAASPAPTPAKHTRTAASIANRAACFQDAAATARDRATAAFTDWERDKYTTAAEAYESAADKLTA